MSSIELKSDGRRILVPVQLLPPDTGFAATGLEGRALLDTGATTSAVRASVAARLGLRTTGKRPLLTAHGESHADRYIFRIAIPPDVEPDAPPCFPYFFPETDGFVLSESFSLEALIGMDILSRCDLVIRRDRTVTLTFG